MRVEALSLWRRANFLRRRRTLCGDRACRSALAVAPCELSTWPTNPLRGSCVSGALSLWRRANFRRSRRTLCGDCACRSALAVAPCELSAWPTNPLGIVRVGALSLRGAVRTFYVADEPSAGIVCRSALAVAPCAFARSPLWRRANVLRRRRTLCRDRACRIALAVAPCERPRSHLESRHRERPRSPRRSIWHLTSEAGRHRETSGRHDPGASITASGI